MTREVAGTMVLQLVLVVAVLGALFYFVRSGQNVGVRAGKRLAFAGFVLISIYAVLRPNDVTVVARWLGIGRGTDLLVYLLVVGFIFGLLNTYLRDREISQHLTNLARQVAIRDAELERREQELARTLRELSAQAGAHANGDGGLSGAGSGADAGHGTDHGADPGTDAAAGSGNGESIVAGAADPAPERGPGAR